MRRKEQLSLDRPPAAHVHAEELERIGLILDANPRMAELVEQDLVWRVRKPEAGARRLSGDQVLRILGVVPRQAAFDGGFASKDNLRDEAKAMGIEDVAFSKKRGLEVSEMTRSGWVYRRLRNFRAGIEGLISFVKHAFGLDRCTWRGAESFKSYEQASVLAANFLTLTRHLLA